MSDWGFDKAALDRYIEREDDCSDDERDLYEVREVECFECGAKFDVPLESARASYKCDDCAERDLLDESGRE